MKTGKAWRIKWSTAAQHPQGARRIREAAETPQSVKKTAEQDGGKEDSVKGAQEGFLLR